MTAFAEAVRRRWGGGGNPTALPAKTSNRGCGACQLEGELADLSQIHLSRAKVREGIDLEEGVRTRHPEIRQVGLREFLEAILQPVLRESMQDHEALPFLFIRHSRNGK